MPVDHDDRIFAAVEKAANAVTDGVKPRPIAAEAIKNLSRTTRDVLAEDAFLELMMWELRDRTRRAERKAETPPTPSPAKDGVRHGSTDKRNGGVLMGCECAECSDLRRGLAEIDARFTAKINDALNTYRATLRMEWTDELLASTFALQDGTRVTWGTASVTQHHERVQMFKANAAANIEGAARHAEAIDTLTTTGASCLYEAVATDAA